MKGRGRESAAGAKEFGRVRLRSPTPARTAPERSFSTLFSKAGSQGSREAARSSRGGRALAPPPGDSIAGGVAAGYRIIEDYMHQGREIARAMWPAGNGVQSSESSGLIERLVRSASDFAGMFSELLRTMATDRRIAPPGSTDLPAFGGEDAEPSRESAPRRNGHATASESPATRTSDRPLVSLDVESKQRIQTTVDLRPGAWDFSLVANELCASDARKPSIKNVVLRSVVEQKRVSVRVRVPDSQPPGTYTGLIVRRSDNATQGRLAVRVLPSRVRVRVRVGQ